MKLVLKLDPSPKLPSDVVAFLEPVIEVGFNLPPDKAISYFRDKGLKASFDYRDMMRDEHDAAFTVAKMLNIDLLKTVRDRVDEALATGQSMDDFRKSLIPHLIEKGWWGKQAMTDHLTGLPAEVELGSAHRLNTIFRTNMMSAYATGEWEMIHRQSDIAPYLMYDAVDDHRTRPEHAQFDSKTLPVDSPFWNTHYPPNGFNCRCGVIQLDETELDELGLEPSKAPELEWYDWRNPRKNVTEQIPRGTDPGFDHNPGKQRIQRLGELLAEKTSILPDDMRQMAEIARALKAPETPTELPFEAVSATITREEAKEKGHYRLHRLLRMTSQEGEKTGAVKLARNNFENSFKNIHESSPSLVLVADEFQQRLLSELRKARSLNQPAVIQGTGKGVKAVREASTKFPDDWTRVADQLGTLYVKYSKSRGWQATLEQPVSRINAFGDAHKKLGRGKKWPAGTGFIVTDESSTALHEYTHRIQAALPQLDRIFNEEHEARTQGDPLRYLSELTGNSVYGRDEVAREDNYYHPYQGREYNQFRTGHKAAEVMTMVYEPLLGQMDFYNAARLKHILFHDPDLVSLAIGLLFHYTPKAKK